MRNALPLALLALTCPASAQIVVTMTVNGSSQNTERYAIDLSSGVATPLFPGWSPPNNDPQLAGAAADDNARVLYFSSNPTSPTLQDVIYAWPYASVTGPQVIVQGPATAAGAAIDCSGLAFGNGQLYALNQYGATADGIYAIDLTTGVATLAYAFVGAFDIGGLDFNAADGKFYGTHDGAVSPGIWAFDIVLQTQTFVAPYPAGITDIDGCAVDSRGAGVVYLIEDNPAPLHAYDLATGTYTTMTVPNSVTGTYTYSGGTWAASYFGPATIGTAYCGPTPSNSTGAASALTASGSALVLDNDVTLAAASLPLNSFGFFLTSRTQGFVTNPGGSQGNLCLGGSIGRYVGPGQIKNSGSTGSFSLVLDLTQTPQPTGLVSIAAGETWNFQTWHRDAVGGSATSNFTNGLTLPFG